MCLHPCAGCADSSLYCLGPLGDFMLASPLCVSIGGGALGLVWCLVLGSLCAGLLHKASFYLFTAWHTSKNTAVRWAVRWGVDVFGHRWWRERKREAGMHEPTRPLPNPKPVQAMIPGRGGRKSSLGNQAVNTWSLSCEQKLWALLNAQSLEEIAPGWPCFWRAWMCLS